MTFTLDTSGTVQGRTSSGATLLWTRHWSDLSPFTQGYVEAVLTELEDGLTYEDCQSAPDGTPSARPAGFSDLAPETLARIVADCERVHSGWKTLAAYNPYTDTGAVFWEQRQKGRNVHPHFPPLTVQLGDDGKVRFA